MVLEYLLRPKEPYDVLMSLHISTWMLGGLGRQTSDTRSPHKQKYRHPTFAQFLSLR